jgi:HAD superfamily hydrolase (TIGR01509 family)
VKYDAVLFDFDGVLADTEPLHFQAWRDTLHPAGVTLGWDYYVSRCIGLADREMIAMLGRQADPPKTLEELWPLYPLKKRRFQSLTEEIRLVSPETIEAINSLRSYRMAVVTSSARSEIERILKKENLLHLFAIGVYGDEVSKLKPDPEPYATACSRLGTSHAVVFEDSEAGLASARAAGCDVVHVPHPDQLPALIRQHVLNFR